MKAQHLHTPEALAARKAAKRLNPLEKARMNPRSLRLAVNAKCFDCEGLGADPDWKWRVGNCLITECSLHPVRPYQRLRNKTMPKGMMS